MSLLSPREGSSSEVPRFRVSLELRFRGTGVGKGVGKRAADVGLRLGDLEREGTAGGHDSGQVR